MEVVGKRYTFNKLFDTDYKIEHIYPSKQADIMRFLRKLPSEDLYKAFSMLFKTLDNEVDVIIKTQSEFDENIKIKNSICNVVSREGLLIYERALCTSKN